MAKPDNTLSLWQAVWICRLLKGAAGALRVNVYQLIAAFGYRGDVSGNKSFRRRGRGLCAAICQSVPDRVAANLGLGDADSRREIERLILRVNEILNAHAVDPPYPAAGRDARHVLEDLEFGVAAHRQNLFDVAETTLLCAWDALPPAVFDLRAPAFEIVLDAASALTHLLTGFSAEPERAAPIFDALLPQIAAYRGDNRVLLLRMARLQRHAANALRAAWGSRQGEALPLMEDALKRHRASGARPHELAGTYLDLAKAALRLSAGWRSQPRSPRLRDLAIESARQAVELSELRSDQASHHGWLWNRYGALSLDSLMGRRRDAYALRDQIWNADWVARFERERPIPFALCRDAARLALAYLDSTPTNLTEVAEAAQAMCGNYANRFAKGKVGTAARALRAAEAGDRARVRDALG